jgi:hypothetical protein
MLYQLRVKISAMKKFWIFKILLLTLFAIPLIGQEPQGFFLDDFSPKSATIPPYENISPPKAKPTITVTVNFADTVARVSKYIYGNNAN